jgi:futalosine hydrolase
MPTVNVLFELSSKVYFCTMPKTLIVAATKNEISPFLENSGFLIRNDEGFFTFGPENDISILITGVGMLNTAYYLGRYSPDSFDHAINVGICGAFKRDIQIGEVLNVVSDTLSEMGAENDNGFIKYLDLGLGGTNLYYNQMHTHYSCLQDVRKVKGITVNTIHGNEQSIEKTIALYDADVESMEGAAFFRGCQSLSSNFFQLRAVSNYVEKRDKSKWNIPLAVNALCNKLTQLIDEIYPELQKQ